ncbi:MAG: prepilin peptidase [Anaerolineales bacterium]|nr:prepilin peptidase [Anaerolineales bacterium]
MSPKVLVWGLIALWVAALTVNDWRTRRVPNWAVYPLWLVAPVVAWAWPLHGGYGLFEALFIAGGLLACAVIWYLRVLSGGDIKLAVPLMILLPYPGFYWAFLAVGVFGSLLMLILWDGGTGWRRFRSVLVNTLAAQRLPAPSETRAASEEVQPPATWMLGLPAILTIVVSLATPM